MKNGFTHDEAWSLPEDERLAYAVAFGEMEGGEFDWQRLRFKEQSS